MAHGCERVQIIFFENKDFNFYYSLQILEALDEDASAQSLNLGDTLEEIVDIMD